MQTPRCMCSFSAIHNRAIEFHVLAEWRAQTLAPLFDEGVVIGRVKVRAEKQIYAEHTLTRYLRIVCFLHWINFVLTFFLSRIRIVAHEIIDSSWFLSMSLNLWWKSKWINSQNKFTVNRRIYWCGYCSSPHSLFLC